MDGREGMGMSGPASYFMHRSMIAPGMSRSVTATNPSFTVQSSVMGISGGLGIGMSHGSAFHVSSPLTISPHGINISPGAVSGISTGVTGMGVIHGEQVKKKRGRPRKYGPDGSVALALSPLSSPPSVSGMASEPSRIGSGLQTQKRGRGRPPGTGRKQQLASLGEWVAGSAGTGFTPHVVTISVGENIVSKIMSFSQQGPRAVCILSANGAVSTVTLKQPASSGGTVTYEGRFEILCLSGSYLLTDEDGSRSRNGGLNVSLSSPDGGVIGGGVGDMLVAASTVQVMVGSFMYGGSKSKSKAKMIQETTKTDQAGGDNQSTPMCSSLPIHGSTSSSLPIQSHAPSMMGGWASARNAHIDIDLMRG